MVLYNSPLLQYNQAMDRIYQSAIQDHLTNDRQMVFLAGPRQVGKTTTAVESAEKAVYLNWDSPEDRRIIAKGSQELKSHIGLDTLRDNARKVIFDELHKYGQWKSFLKGFYDKHGAECRIIVTGSARLNVYKRGGDSLMGRYFLYRMHPLSIGELAEPRLRDTEISLPQRVPQGDIDQLLRYGGFPEPFLRGNTRFYNRWSRLRMEQLFREEVRDLTRIQEIQSIELLAELLSSQSGDLTNYTSLASDLSVSVDSVTRWLAILESLFHTFRIRPWYRNVPKSLRKQPKTYLVDWSLVQDPGKRNENFLACHLLKAVQLWTDLGFGKYELFFLRDKDKHEVDFLVTKNDHPWFLVEVKSSENPSINRALYLFQDRLKAKHAFQVVFDMEYAERDCFLATTPIKVPVSTFLSQLV